MRAGWAPRPVRGDAPRMRRRDIGLGVGAIVCAATGLAVLVFARGPDRVSGLPMLLFALVLAFVPVSGRLAARSGAEPRLDRVEHDGVPQPALVIPGRRSSCGCCAMAASSSRPAAWRWRSPRGARRPS